MLITLSILGLCIAAVLTIGLWHGSGTIFDFLAGQIELEPRQLDRAISQNGAKDASYTVTVTVDPSHPIAQISPEYLSFSIDASQVTGGKWLYEVTAPDIFGQVVQVNGQVLQINQDGKLPDLAGLGRTIAMGSPITIHPLSYTFIQFSR